MSNEDAINNLGADNHKTEAEIKAEAAKKKAEKFAANPDNFLDLDDTVMACEKSGDRFAFFVNNKASRFDIDIAIQELWHSIIVRRMNMDMRAQMEQQEKNKIITPSVMPKKHGIMDFVRRK